MSLAKKLYHIGSTISDDEIAQMIEMTRLNEANDYIVLCVNFSIQDNILKSVSINKSSLDNIKTFFTKKIAGTSDSYYLYPNFIYEDESNLYNKFQNTSYTLEKSILIYANDKNQKNSKLVFEYIKNYNEDILGLKNFEKANYVLILQINQKSFYEIMPEVLENYINDFAQIHTDLSKKKCVDFITQKEEICGYNPNIKIFTMDNYDPAFKYQLINKMPLSKNSAKAIKVGWMFAIKHLIFDYKGLEYLIIPSMVKFDEKIYKNLLEYLKTSNSTETLSSKENTFLRKLYSQIENFKEINSFTLDIIFTKINKTDLSFKILSSLEDVLPSRIRKVVNSMKEQNISDSFGVEQNDQDSNFYLRDYFARKEMYAKKINKTKNLQDTITQERIYLAKILLGYIKIDKKQLYKQFEHHRNYDFENKKKLTKEGFKDWIAFSDGYVKKEDKILHFLNSINAIKGAQYV